MTLVGYVSKSSGLPGNHLVNPSHQLDLFLRGGSPAAHALLVIKATLPWRFVLLGGAARDILLDGAAAIPRDLDIVVEGASVGELAAIFPLGRNYFGGLQGEMTGVKVDIWPLASSWGLRGLEHPSFQDLVQRTTFNLEAIAFELGSELIVYEAGYFRCMEEKELELVFEPVPVPPLNLIRAALFCRRFGLHPGPKLRAFIQTHREQIPIWRLMVLLAKIYPAATLTKEELIEFLSLS